MSEKLGLGYRALSRYLRSGVKAVIDLQSNYRSANERRMYAESGNKEARQFLEDIFGIEEPETLADIYKERFHKLAAEIKAEWEKEEKEDD